MNGLLLAFLLFQGNQPVGVITGRIVSPAGVPSPGVRVYGMAVRDTVTAAGGGATLESITQTDDSGRYRLEIPPGRYFVAAGSVEAPTYFPGTTDLSQARVVSVAAGAVVINVDFSRFVPAARTGDVTMGSAATGVLSGVIRNADGTPAAGLTVGAYPTAMLQSPTSNWPRATTDRTGRYRIANVPPGVYYIATGFADAPTFYPGTDDLTKATALTTTSTTMLDALHFTVGNATSSVLVRGQVAAAGMPAAGRSVALQRTSPIPFLVFSNLRHRPVQLATTGRDGSFEIKVFAKGTYSMTASLPGVSSLSRELIVADQPVINVQFSFAVAALSARVLMDTGAVFPDAPALDGAAASTLRDSNFTATTVFPLAADGRFRGFLEPGEYRFFLRVLPDDYVVKSITSGNVDLIKETLKVSSTTTVNVEIRMGRRADSAAPDFSVRGRVLDSLTKGPSTAERVQLCCLASGPAERLSTRIRPDGAFAFAAVPPGGYSAELRGRSTFELPDSRIEVGAGTTERTLTSIRLVVPLVVYTKVEGSSPSEASSFSVTFKSPGGVTVSGAVPVSGALAVIAVPNGDSYTMTVSNVPAGYTVKSIVAGSSDLRKQPLPVGQYASSVPGIVVTLASQPPN